MTRPLTLPEIRSEGLKALLDRLGPADTARFLQQCDPGHGDYTRERRAWLDRADLDQLVQGLTERRTG